MEPEPLPPSTIRPELARGIQVDARSDIFSLGVVIYETAAGRLPFEGSSTNEILASILSDKQPLPLARFAGEGHKPVALLTVEYRFP